MHNSVYSIVREEFEKNISISDIDIKNSINTFEVSIDNAISIIVDSINAPHEKNVELIESILEFIQPYYINDQLASMIKSIANRFNKDEIKIHDFHSRLKKSKDFSKYEQVIIDNLH